MEVNRELERGRCQSEDRTGEGITKRRTTTEEVTKNQMIIPFLGLRRNVERLLKGE